MKRLVGVTALALLVLVAPAGAANKNPSAVGKTYLQLVFVHSTPASLAKARALTAPGSVAEQYAIFQAALTQGLQADGVPSSTNNGTVKQQTRQFTVCGTTTTPTTTPGTCSSFSGFKLDRKGRLVSFTVAGTQLAGVIAGPGQPSSPAAGATLSLVGAYQSPASGELIIVLNAHGAPDGPRNVFVTSASYVEPNGQQLQVQPGNVAQPQEGLVQPNATASMVAIFPGAAIGGTLTLPVSNPADLTQTGQAQLHIG